MELLPFLREASQYSAVIILAMYGLLSLQFKLMGAKLRKEQEDNSRKLEKSEDVRHGRIDDALLQIRDIIANEMRVLENKISAVELKWSERYGEHGQRISSLEGRQQS